MDLEVFLHKRTQEAVTVWTGGKEAFRPGGCLKVSIFTKIGFSKISSKSLPV